MKNFAKIVVLALLGASVVPLFGQGESIPWFTFDSGGGVSSAAPFSLNGTIGQPDASPRMSGGGFTVTGGFWSLPAADFTGEGPELSVTFLPIGARGQVRISWSPALTGYVLQETRELSPVEWIDVANGSTTPQFFPANTSAKYYRLRKP